MKKIYAHQGRNLKGRLHHVHKFPSAVVAQAKVFSKCGI
jgi:hypothetical protein